MQAAINRGDEYLQQQIDALGHYRNVVTTPAIAANTQGLQNLQVLEIPRIWDDVNTIGHNQNLDRQFDSDWNTEQDQRIDQLGQQVLEIPAVIFDTLSPQIGDVARQSQECCRQQQGAINTFWQFFLNTWPITLVEIDQKIVNNITNFFNEHITNVFQQFTTYVNNYVTEQVTNINCYITNQVKRGVECFQYNWCQHARAHWPMMLECNFSRTARSNSYKPQAWEGKADFSYLLQRELDLGQQQRTGAYQALYQKAKETDEKYREYAQNHTIRDEFTMPSPPTWIFKEPNGCEEMVAELLLTLPSLLPQEPDPCKALKARKC